MADTTTLLDLPLTTLAPLAYGYIAYRVAYDGHEEGHGAFDAALLTVVFAAVSRMVLEIEHDNFPWDLRYVASLIAAVSAAAAWRKWLAHRFKAVITRAGINTSDRRVSALGTFIASRPTLTQIVVRKRDGTALMSAPLGRFDAQPTRSCILGADGSVGLYVTAFRNAGQQEWNDIDPQEGAYGLRLTIIPAGEVSEIEVVR